MQLQKMSILLYFILVPVTSNKVIKSENSDNVCTIKNKISADHIDITLNDLSQDDPFLVKLIRERYLIEPSKKAINLTKPASTETLKGQFGQPIFLDEGHFK